MIIFSDYKVEVLEMPVAILGHVVRGVVTGVVAASVIVSVVWGLLF